jgi:hypothetical protein
VQPLVEFPFSGSRDVKAVLGPLAVLVGLNKTVAFEALQGGVYLSDVEWPHLTGPCFELLLKLESVLGALAE